MTIKFKLPLVDDDLNYKDPDDKGKGYRVKKGKEELKGNLPIKKGGRVSKKNPPSHHHSTVTDLARFLGLSTSVPFCRAT